MISLLLASVLGVVLADKRCHRELDSSKCGAKESGISMLQFRQSSIQKKAAVTELSVFDRDPAFELPAEKCHCDLRELECLPKVECLQVLVANDQHSIALGVNVRKELKKLATFQGQALPFIPVGKCFQQTAVRNWKQWATTNTLYSGFQQRDHFAVDDSWRDYKFCRDNNRNGASCLFREFTDDESPTGSLEELSLLEKEVDKDELSQSIANLRRVQDGKGLPVDQLLSFAHILRMQFSLQPSITQAIAHRLGEIHLDKRALRVSLHIRRADACGHSSKDNELYAGSPSTIDSGPQVSGKRLCYQTKVYVDKLNQISDLYGMPLEVYLSTDDSASVIDEIREEAPALYEKTTFHFANYSRSKFEYEGMIESAKDKEGKGREGFMTESALVDLWTLSHGQIYVGSLGSRFSKAGYLLATARHNRVIPFVSVDGHSLCCEIDEHCEKATAAMKTMEDCLTFAHELSHRKINDDYWQVGSTLRYK